MDLMQELIKRDKEKANSKERQDILNAEYPDEYCEETESYEIETELEFGE